MFRSLFAKSFGGRPADLPRFYPDLDEIQLAEFLSKSDFHRIKSFDNFSIFLLCTWRTVVFDDR